MFTAKLVSSIQSILADITLDTYEIPTLLDLFPSLSVFSSSPHRGITSQHKMDKRAVNTGDVALYLHSSGSTGLPKSIPITFLQLLEGMRGRK